MTVKELIEVLKKYPNQDITVVVASSDPSKIIEGTIQVDEVFIGKTKLPILFIGDRK